MRLLLVLLLYGLALARFTPAEIEAAQKRCKTHCEKSATGLHFSPSCMKQCWSEFFHRVPSMAAPKQVHPSQLEILTPAQVAASKQQQQLKKKIQYHHPPKKAIMVEIPYRNVRAVHFKEHLAALRAKQVAMMAEVKREHELITRNITGAATIGVSLLVLLFCVLFLS